MSGTISYGQISPGDLAEAHKELEGMSNCTQCHTLGEKVTNAKCLDCHDDIQDLLNNNKGYHANTKIAKQDCFECHSDHHGLKFDMVRFDQDNFNHDLTGYELEGQHDVIDCKECHMPDNIQNNEIRKRQNSFLGLDQECLSCHDDYHQQTLANDCISCHGMDSFEPAMNFDHDETEYPLNGNHIDVDCLECHQKTTKNGLEFQEFAGIAFTDCKSCHDDPHNNKLPGDCKACHTETSFDLFNGHGKFNHNTTNFTLKGKHKVVDCFECHKESTNPLLVFQDNLKVDESSCIECHSDTHEGKFGLDCAKCHNENSFLNLNNMDFFDHSVTDYPLKGKHIGVDCKQCHEGRFTEAIDFSACNKCHTDYHQSEFQENGISPDCVECHSLEKGFDYSLYTLEQHQTTSFPLEGAHFATPCYACHVSEKEDRWTFRNLGSDCVDCHLDIHEDYISDTFYPEQNCMACHINESWTDLTFNHNLTDWALTGRHIEVECRACHFIENIDNAPVVTQNFTNLDTNCASCHEDNHGGSFAIDGVTDCKSCHVTNSWFPEYFDHNTTNFPLEGKHTEIECSSCHTSNIENGKTVILYKINKFKCTDCHL